MWAFLPTHTHTHTHAHKLTGSPSLGAPGGHIQVLIRSLMAPVELGRGEERRGEEKKKEERKQERKQKRKQERTPSKRRRAEETRKG